MKTMTDQGKKTGCAEKTDFSGVPVYQCKLCEGVAFKVDSRAAPNVLVTFANNGPGVVEVDGIPRYIIHRCPTGARAIAEIVGLVPEELMAQATMKNVEADESMN